MIFYSMRLDEKEFLLDKKGYHDGIGVYDKMQIENKETLPRRKNKL
jgi:hypothetical protein